MADKWVSHFFRGLDLKGAFANLLWENDKQIFAPQKAIDGAALVIDPPLASIIEVVGADTYICEAPAGTAANESGWRIQKVTVAAGVTSITWANGGQFDQVAANRTTLTFS